MSVTFCVNADFGSLTLFVGTSALAVVQDFFAQADMFRRDFDEFVVVNEFQREFQRHVLYWH